jgi:hypothetical protein
MVTVTTNDLIRALLIRRHQHMYLAAARLGISHTRLSNVLRGREPWTPELKRGVAELLDAGEEEPAGS